MRIEGCDTKMTKCLLKIKRGPNLGDPDLNVPTSEAQQEAQPADLEKKLKITHL